MQIPPADVVVRWAKNVDSEGRRGHRGQQAHADFAHRRVCNDDQRHPVCIQAQRFKEDLQVTRNTMTVIVLLVASVRSNNSRMGGGSWQVGDVCNILFGVDSLVWVSVYGSPRLLRYRSVKTARAQRVEQHAWQVCYRHGLNINQLTHGMDG